VALMGFCGIRLSEAARLSWEKAIWFFLRFFFSSSLSL
jgi:hypothetical protein